jgi:hypothetical protein
MARTFTRNARDYLPDTYGPFDVDSFTNANTKALVLTLTADPAWPAKPAVDPPQFIMTIRMRWENGNGADFNLEFDPRNRDGSVSNPTSFTIGIPHGTKIGPIANGNIEFTLNVPLRVAINLAAV